ncbi:MAG: DUF1416 domain-containing protein [Saprospiraceae bacterium]|nr:DUF1416 domain-containing protein [Saprospiraceae bacterium]
MNLKAFFTILLCLFSFITFTQSTILKGRIIADDGTPLVGAHVQLIEIKKGAFTNEKVLSAFRKFRKATTR